MRISLLFLGIGIYTYYGGVSDRPLSCPSNAVIQTSFVGIISAVCISEKQGVDIAAFEEFGEIDPILQISLTS